jgi:hypothetical protein
LNPIENGTSFENSTPAIPTSSTFNELCHEPNYRNIQQRLQQIGETRKWKNYGKLIAQFPRCRWLTLRTGDGSLDGALAQISMLDALAAGNSMKRGNCGMQRDDATANQRATTFHGGKTWRISIFTENWVNGWDVLKTLKCVIESEDSEASLWVSSRCSIIGGNYSLSSSDLICTTSRVSVLDQFTGIKLKSAILIVLMKAIASTCAVAD